MQSVYELLTDQAPTPCTPQRISERTGISIYLIRQAIRALSERRLIKKVTAHDGYTAVDLEPGRPHAHLHVLSEAQWNEGSPTPECFQSPPTSEQPAQTSR